MKHFPASLYVKSTAWTQLPPTGATLARELASAYERSEYVTELARLSGRTEQYVEWQLSLNTVVPAWLLTAVLRLRKLRLSDDASYNESSRSPRKRSHG